MRDHATSFAIALLAGWMAVAIVLSAIPESVARWMALAVLFSGAAAASGGLLWGLVSFRWRLFVMGAICLMTWPLAGTLLDPGPSDPGAPQNWRLLAGFGSLVLLLAIYPTVVDRLLLGVPHRRLQADLKHLAEFLEGEFLFEYPRVQFRDRGVPFVIAPKVVDRRKDLAFLECIGPWEDAGFRCEVHPAGVWASVKGLLGMHDVQTGALRFDRDFEVTANDTGKCVAMLRTARGRLERFLEVHGEFQMTIQTGRFCVVMGAEIGKPNSQRRFIRDVLSLYHAARQEKHAPPLEQTPDVRTIGATTEIEVWTPRQPICQICGDAIEGVHIECRRCRTPHHADCWEYFGACSTYGCGSRVCRRTS